MKGPALVIMARAPLPGKIKTRLQPDITAEQSASVCRAFIRDMVSLSVSVPGCTPFLAFTPQKCGKVFEEFRNTKIELIPQTGRGLGQRMYNVMRDLESLEYSPVVVVGSDIPTLQPGTLARALDALDKNDLCLGPSTDGGYYLVGARHIDDRVFRSIPWSTSKVLEHTLRKVQKAGFSFVLLEEYSDIDTFADLKKLYEDIKQLCLNHDAVIPVHTKAWLEKTQISP